MNFSLIAWAISIFILLVILVRAFLAGDDTYGSELEHYIISHNPQNHADIEKLQQEYDLKKTRNRVL